MTSSPSNEAAGDYVPQGVLGVEHAGAGYEPYSLQFRPIITFSVVLIVSCILIAIGLGAMMQDFAREEKSDKTLRPVMYRDETGQFPEPRLQSNPAADMARQVSKEDAIYEQYGWVDRKKGIVRIPISRAMTLLEQKGLPYRKPGERPKAPERTKDEPQPEAPAPKAEAEKSS